QSLFQPPPYHRELHSFPTRRSSDLVQQQVRNFERTINEYQFKEPFSRFLSQFYKNNRQMGSSDRRMNSRFCYNFFRLGKAFSNLVFPRNLASLNFFVKKTLP